MTGTQAHTFVISLPGTATSAVHQGDLTGTVVARWWGVGWILKALPLLAVILAMVLLGTARFVSAWWRKPARLFLVPIAFSAVGVIHRPWVGLMLIDQTATGGGLSAASSRRGSCRSRHSP